MAIEDLREIGNILYRVGADGMLYPVRRLKADETPTRKQPTKPGLLSGTGIPERAGMINQMLNPVEAIGGSMRASERMLAPDTAGWDRVQALGDMLSGVAGVAAPAAIAGRAGVPAATAVMEGMLGWSPTGQAAAETARSAGRAIAERANLPGAVPTMYSNPVPGLLGDTLPAPRNEAEAIAKNILEQRATGDVSGVTEEMMAAADPQYMYANTPLPMDEASRMARAAISEGKSGYRADKDLFSFREGQGKQTGIGVTMSNDPAIANSYVGKGEAIYPLINLGEKGAVIDASGARWDDISPYSEMRLTNGREMQLSDVMPPENWLEDYQLAELEHYIATGTRLPDSDFGYSTDDVARFLKGKGADYTSFENIVDPGAYGQFKTPESNAPATTTMVANPANVRSRFARFDPMFSHLRNLSAGVAISPLAYGLLSDPTDRGRNQ